MAVAGLFEHPLYNIIIPHPLDEIVHSVKSYSVHEMETVFFHLVK